MSKTKNTFLLLMVIGLAFAFQSKAFAQEPWDEKQLIAPSGLEEKIADENKKPPLIISVSPEGAHGIGPGKGIKGAIDFGAADEPQNLEKLKASLEELSKDTEIVLYAVVVPLMYALIYVRLSLCSTKWNSPTTNF